MCPFRRARVRGKRELFGTMLSTCGLWIGSTVLVAAALAAACGENEQGQDNRSQLPTSTATVGRTPAPAPSTVNPTPTGSKTSMPTPETAAYGLECLVINSNPEGPLPANVYALTGTFTPPEAAEAGAEEVAGLRVDVPEGYALIRFSKGTAKFQVGGLRVDITGEVGEAVRSGDLSTTADYQGYLTVGINEERTYASSQHTYKIVGKIVYSVSDLGTAASTMASYDITVTGGGFGTAPKTCRKP
jgi:hypothetical protein